MEVTQVAALLKETINTLCIKDKAETQCLLQAPEYLFVSTRVAAAYPDLLESIVIRAYESYLPGQLSRKWNFGPGMLQWPTIVSSFLKVFSSRISPML